MNDKAKQDQLADIVRLDDNAFTVEKIERIALDSSFRRTCEETYQDRLYSLILLSLTHESYPEEEAASLWLKILSHKRLLAYLLGRDVGVSVACHDYLANIEGSLSEPKIIEENKSGFVTGSSTLDELTGLYLRDVFDVVLQKEIEESNRKKTPVCLLMVDIDDFKTVNDTWGHQTGDQVLEQLGETIGRSVREMDLVARYGGEEIAVIMPDTRMKQASDVAERIRLNVENTRFDEFSVTVSAGVSQTDREISTPEKLIEAADTALYRAKGTGKNKVCVSDGNEGE